MQDLRVIGVEDGALLVTTDDGERYRIPVDDALQSRIRQAVTMPTGDERKLSPREIQAHIRSGMSAKDVASVTGAPLEYIERFEGPVLAEREFIVQSALGVTVRTALEDADAEGSTFGAVITQRLTALGASDERWASWKEENTGWIVKLAFTASQIDHDARWTFDPKKQALAPVNGEAIQLSQQGDASSPLIPRLRAVSADRSSDTSRFDSGAFLLDDDIEPMREPSEPQSEAVAESSPTNQTADLLEALRRRRGERETAGYGDDELAPADQNVTGAIRLIDVRLDETVMLEGLADEPENADPAAPAHQSKASARKGRASMPSWDDIVFGARHDDDPA